MTTSAYRTEIRTMLGISFRVDWESDHDAGPPWSACDGHGEVSEWTSRDKLPGELVLAEHRGSKRFYDYAAAVRTARADRWGHRECPANATRGQQAAFAARKDFEYLKGWCDDDWHYCRVVVTMLVQGEDTDGWDSCGGFESDDDAGQEECIVMMMRELIMNLKKPGLLPVPTTTPSPRDWAAEPAMPVGTTREYDGVMYAAVRIRDYVLAQGATGVADLCWKCPAAHTCGGSLCASDASDVFIVPLDTVPLLALAGALE